MDEIGGIKSENVPKRTPVLDSETKENFPDDQIDRQWRLTTELIKREIQTKPEFRKALLSLSLEPVSEELPKKLVTIAQSTSQRLSKLSQRFDPQLGEYLRLDPVPDDLITPDIKNTRTLSSPEEKWNFYLSSSKPEKFLNDDIKRKFFLKGVTPEERQMIIKRYQFARDVKLLALSAEILEQKSIKPNQFGEISLPSGTTIHINPEKLDTDPNLLNPLTWEKRKMIKDRVYEIEIKGKKYILKEKKTARHIDTKKHGHQDGLSSQSEFKTAKFFQENGTQQNDEILVSWENPIGFVTFPDGFQFTVFDHEENLISPFKVIKPLFQAIMQNREQFENEYQQIAKLAKELKKEPICQTYPEVKKSKNEPELTFESYARVKADYLERKATHILGTIISENSYGNSDLDGYVFKIHTKPKVLLEILGMDFEYFYPIDPKEAKKILKRGVDSRAESIEKQIFRGWWWDQNYTTKMQQAAYIALFKIESK